MGQQISEDENSVGQEGRTTDEAQICIDSLGWRTTPWVPPPLGQHAPLFLNLFLHHRPREKDTRSLRSGPGFLGHIQSEGVLTGVMGWTHTLTPLHYGHACVHTAGHSLGALGALR